MQSIIEISKQDFQTLVLRSNKNMHIEDLSEFFSQCLKSDLIQNEHFNEDDQLLYEENIPNMTRRRNQEVTYLYNNVYQVISEKKVAYYKQPGWFFFWVAKVLYVLDIKLDYENNPVDPYSITMRDIQRAIIKINAIESTMASELWTIIDIDNFTQFCEDHADEAIGNEDEEYETWMVHLLQTMANIHITRDEYSYRFAILSKTRIGFETVGVYFVEIATPRWLRDLNNALKHIYESGGQISCYPARLNTWGDVLKVINVATE